jgi:hypothetical protein
MAVFTTVTKNSLAFPAPAVNVTGPFFLNIGSGFNLLISTNYKLIIQPGRNVTIWTKQPKG